MLYRMGVPALLALLAIVAIGLWRHRDLAGIGAARPHRTLRVTVIAMFAAALVTILFNDALGVPTSPSSSGPRWA